MRSKHYDFQFKVIRVRFESKHDGGELGVVCSVTRCYTHSQLLLALDKINTQILNYSECCTIHTNAYNFMHVLHTNTKYYIIVI